MTALAGTLFSPYKIRDVTLRNRTVLAPMMQCKAIDGFASDWHFAHFSKFALGGFGVVMTEAVAVEPRGRITYGDLGLWSDEFIPSLKRITDFIHAQGSLAAIQLAHAGRKACWQRPWEGNGPLSSSDVMRGEPPWDIVGPSSLSVGDSYQTPKALSIPAIKQIIKQFGYAAKRADTAGFDVIEIHGAHGYLIASFLTPLVNNRVDEYGIDRAGRMRFALEVVAEIRANWPEKKPLFFRISAEDGGGEGGWGLEDSILLSVALGRAGVDVVDCSSGGLRTSATLANQARGPGYQVPFAERIRREGAVPTMAVGLILDGPQADAIIRNGQADLVAIGRQAMFDPYWPHHAAQQLNTDIHFEAWDPSAGWWLDKRTGGLAQVGYSASGARLSRE